MQISLRDHRNLFYIFIFLLNVFNIRMKIVLKKVPPVKILMLASKQLVNVSANVEKLIKSMSSFLVQNVTLSELNGKT